MWSSGPPLRIPLSAPDVTAAEVEAVSAVLRSGALSLGPKLAAFERAFAGFVGARRAVAVSSGTAGLHLAVRALGLGPGDEVVTTPFSFVASANAIVYERARPVFADIDPDSLNLDPERVEAALTPQTRALLVVHLFGRPAPMRELLAIAARRGVPVIEDACEAIGGWYDDRRLGTLGEIGVYAFYPNKQITTAEGGLVVSDREDLADRIVGLRNHGRHPSDPGVHTELGYNYRLSDLHCALGLAQLDRLESILERRHRVALEYHSRLSAHPDLIAPEPNSPHGRTSWFVYVVRLREWFDSADRDWIAEQLLRRGIGCGRYFPPIHLQPFYRSSFGHAAGEFPVVERVAARTLALPFFNRITSEQVEEVCETLTALCVERRARRSDRS
jgi:perosamine synthetase